jgi:hypothetical protein
MLGVLSYETLHHCYADRFGPQKMVTVPSESSSQTSLLSDQPDAQPEVPAERNEIVLGFRRLIQWLLSAVEPSF